jgi:hypothetical protein
MKQKGFAPIIILVLIVLAVIGYFGYKNYWPKIQTMVVPSPATSATADPTVNWKTYTNGVISFKYPETWTVVQGNSNAPTYPKDTIVLKSTLSSFDVSLVIQDYNSSITPKNTLLNFVKNTYGDFQTQITNQTDSTASGYIVQSAQNSQLTITIKVITNNQKSLIATTVLQTDKMNTFDQILSTFKFLGTSTTPTPVPTTNLLPTTGWQKAENSTFSIKYPSDRFTVVTNDKYIQLTRAGQPNPGPDFLLFTNGTNSAQDWYLNYYSYSASEIGTNIFFKQKKLESISAFEVSTKNSPNYVQSIIASKGSYIVDLETQDSDLNLMETLISTLVFK